MKTRFLVTLMIFSILFFPPHIFASCGSPSIIGAEFYNFDSAHVVFVGTVTDIYNPHPETHTGTEEYDTITFDVIRILKGDAGNGTATSRHGSIKYDQFNIGESYIVYAFGGMREISQCTPPVLLSDASSLTIHEIMNYYVLFLLIGIISAVLIAVRIWRKRK